MPVLSACHYPTMDEDVTGEATDIDRKQQKKRTATPQTMRTAQRIAATIAEAHENARYVIENNLRKVPPYFYTYNTNAKERWYGRRLLEIFSTEFRDREESYYRDAIASGRVRLNSTVVDASAIVRNGDVISHEIHRHEPPVSPLDLKIVSEDESLGMIVINKPAGIPVHPAGRYRHNSIINIMRYEMGLNVISSCNRLDRLTSGLMIMATKKSTANKVGLLMQERSIRKEYVAKVAGVFPEGEIICDDPILTVNPKFGLNRIRNPGGKHALTVFRRLSTNGKTSIVHCKPLTGRLVEP